MTIFFFSLTHVAENGMILLFSMAEQYSSVYMYHSFFFHSFVDGYLGCSHILAMINSAAMNIGVNVSFQTMFLSGYAREWDCKITR